MRLTYISSRVKGTSINLKNRFAGYNIELVVRQENIREVMDFVMDKLPGILKPSFVIFTSSNGPVIQWQRPTDI